MILAAGRGQRMGALTDSVPKPLLELHGETLLGRQLRRLAESGIREVVINLSYRGDQIRKSIGDGSDYGLVVSYSQEPETPLETAGGIIQALPLLGSEPFVVVNADVVSDFDPGQLQPGPVDGLLVLVPNPEHNPEGDYGLDADGLLVPDEPRYTFSGISLLSPALFAGLEPGRRALSDVFDSAIAARRLSGLVYYGDWHDVGTPERLQQAAAADSGTR